MTRMHTFKLVGAAGAAIFTVGAMATPALAASQEVDYSCFSGTITIPVTFDAGTLPTSMVAGQTVKQTISGGNVHLDSGTVDIAKSQGWTAVSGTITGTTGTAFKFNVAKRLLPTTPSTALDLPTTGAFTLHPTTAGTYSVKAGNSSANIQGWKGSTGGTKANAIPLSCTAPTDGSQNIGTVAVTKDSSKTKVTNSYSAKTKVDKATAKVSGATFGLAGTGKVTFTLKKGTHKIKTLTGTLKKGATTVQFKNIKTKGTYTVTTKYAGNGGLKASNGKATFKVK